MSISELSAYERSRWQELMDHWDRRANSRGLPNWLNDAGSAVAARAARAGEKIGEALPPGVERAVSRAGDAVIDHALKPTADAVLKLLELVDAWILELTDPAQVVKIARKRGIGSTTSATFETTISRTAIGC